MPKTTLQNAIDSATLAFNLAMEPARVAYDSAVGPALRAFDEAWERSGYPTSDPEWHENLKALHRAFVAARIANNAAYDMAWQTAHADYTRELSRAYTAFKSDSKGE